MNIGTLGSESGEGILTEKQQRANELREKLPELLVNPHHESAKIIEIVRELKAFLDDPECDLGQDLKEHYRKSYDSIEELETRCLLG